MEPFYNYNKNSSFKNLSDESMKLALINFDNDFDSKLCL